MVDILAQPKKISYYMNREDDRGSFFGLMNQGSWQEVNFVTTKTGERPEA